MGTTKNILMQEFNGVDYDTLYPSIQPDFPNDLANMYIWKKWKNSFDETVNNFPTDYKLVLTQGDIGDRTVYVSDKYDFNQLTNTYYLVNPSTVVFTLDINDCKQKLKQLAGKYALLESLSNNYKYSRLVANSSTDGQRVYQFPQDIANATVEYSYISILSESCVYYYGVSANYYTNRKYTLTYYGYDLTPTHTPPTDEYSRDDLGILCDKGFYRSYVGTGANQAVLELQFPFQPRIVMFSTGKQSINQYFTYPCMIWVQGTKQIYWDQYNDINFTLNENKLQMTTKGSTTKEYWNKNSEVYYYWAR